MQNGFWGRRFEEGGPGKVRGVPCLRIQTWAAQHCGVFQDLSGLRLWPAEAGGIPGPQVRGTGGTLICGLQSLQDRGHPPAFFRIYRDLGSGLLRPVESRVPKCEGPGAPSSVVYRACRTGGTLICSLQSLQDRGHPHLWFTEPAGPGAPAHPPTGDILRAAPPQPRLPANCRRSNNRPIQ
jgi:hypothetical protein